MSSLLDSVLRQDRSVSEELSTQRIKGLIWARVSTDMQEERGLSLPEQLRQMREYAEVHGFEIVQEYHEAASAFKRESKRVEFHRMLAHAQADREIKVILVHDYSRFSRDSLKARTLVRDLKNKGIRVISLNDIEVDPESVAGVYMEAITFAKNEAYSREVAFHTRKGCRANVQTRDPETGWCYKNGGQPLFGYKAERLVRGEERKGHPIIKSIWVPDDRVVAGKTIAEWAKHCLVELAANGASLDALRDFCNRNGIPAPRRSYWGSTTWHSLLHANAVLQYAGYGVWNVRGKNQRYNPASEWVIVENAHPALITEEDARLILSIREERSKRHAWQTGAQAQSKDSRFLLSGGLFKCDRCGANMTGFTSCNGKGRKGLYYVCGSAHYRKSLGCGKAVFVDKEIIEQAVFNEIQAQFSAWSNEEEFTNRVNEAVLELWEQSTDNEAELRERLSAIDAKLINVRKAVEEGLDDVSWANIRLRELGREKAELEQKLASTVSSLKCPKLNTAAVKSYQERFPQLLMHGTNGELRQLIRHFVDSIHLKPSEQDSEANEPVAHEIVINLKAIPASFVTGLGAGTRSVAIYNAYALFMRQMLLRRNGRHAAYVAG